MFNYVKENASHFYVIEIENTLVIKDVGKKIKILGTKRIYFYWYFNNFYNFILYFG